MHIHRCDGSLCKSVEGHHCIYESSDFWIFFLPPLIAQQIKELDIPQSNSGKFTRKRKFSMVTNRYPTFWFFWKDHWFNISLTLLPENKHNLLLRISTPPLIEEKAFKYIELDLALSLNSEKGIEFLYNNDYQTNSQKMKYNPQLKKEISKIIREIFQLLKSNWFSKLTEESWINFLWEKVLISTGQSKSEFYREVNSDKKDEEFSDLGVEIGEIN
ncbi:RNAase [Mycoplasma ovis str. Michigan]|uniref:RNAase n=1 Tax=Mycoplasma ovis str. Michigan TaxID=1415773 RepID=A0ABM5P0R4_9MOLU|nr:RNAase [Mycoplasma ovis str. Michigan]